MAFLSNHNRLCQSNYSNYQPGSLLALRENLWDSSVLDPPPPSPPASKAQTKTWLQFCRGKTSHLITRAEKMGLLLIWHLVIFVWERFLPCNFFQTNQEQSFGKIIPHEGLLVFLYLTPTNTTPALSLNVLVYSWRIALHPEMQCIILVSGHLDKVRWTEGICWLVRLRQFVLFAGIHKEWLCIVLSIPHLWIWKPCQTHFSQFGGYQSFHKFLAPD